MVEFSSLIAQLKAFDSLPSDLVPAAQREQAVAALQLILDGVAKQMNDRFEEE